MNYIEDAPPRTTAAGGPRLAVDGLGGVHVLFFDRRDQGTDLWYTRSLDHGATWLAPNIRINDSGHGPTDDEFSPSVAVDRNGHVYMIWGRSTLDRIFFDVSSDYGATFETEDRVILERTVSAFLAAARLACDSNGNVYVQWLLRADDLTVTDVMFMVSHDSGATFDSPIALTSPGANARDHHMAVDELGHVYSIWWDDPDGGLDMFCRVSADAGDSFGPEIRLDTDSPGAAHSLDARVAANCSGDVVVTWYDCRISVDVFSNSSHDFGATWSAADRRVSRGSPQIFSNFAELALGDDGHAYAIWEDRQFGQRDLLCAVSLDGGDTWEEPFRANPNPGCVAQSRVACDGSGNVYFSWENICPATFGSYTIYASPSLGLSLRPGVPGVILMGPEGGTIPLLAAMENFTSAPLSDLTVWINGTIVTRRRDSAPALGPVVVSLGPGRMRSKNLSLRVPGRVPSGLYRINLRASGSGLSDRSSFCLLKSE